MRWQRLLYCTQSRSPYRLATRRTSYHDVAMYQYCSPDVHIGAIQSNTLRSSTYEKEAETDTLWKVKVAGELGKCFLSHHGGSFALDDQSQLTIFEMVNWSPDW